MSRYGQGQKGMRGEKITIYLKGPVAGEIREVAAEHDRSISWVIEKAWSLGQAALKQLLMGGSDEREG